jgi:SAM-dependent methyltransferase
MEYKQGFTTDMPSLRELDELKACGFRNTEKDYSKYVEVLASIGCSPGDKVLDYGCSWGYGSWQLAQAGYIVTGYEISRPRCEYARTRMGVNITFSLDEIEAPFDVFFSSHVLEHVPSVGLCIELARKLVKPSGWFVAFTPNGSEAFKARNYDSYMKLWGLVHPNFLDDRYYKSVFRRESYIIDSSSYDLASIGQWATSSRGKSNVHQRVLKLDGDELLVVARIST